MPAMASSSAARRLVLIPASPPTRPTKSDAVLKRYRLARVSLEGRDPARDARFAHLRASHD
jgi:hypothetical protein